MIWLVKVRIKMVDFDSFCPFYSRRRAGTTPRASTLVKNVIDATLERLLPWSERLFGRYTPCRPSGFVAKMLIHHLSKLTLSHYVVDCAEQCPLKRIQFVRRRRLMLSSTRRNR
jgi:hypothetical protein